MEQTESVETAKSPAASKKTHNKSFSELFSMAELGYYGSAVIVYILLGVLLRTVVLNFVVGPLFFIGWIWVVPPLWRRLRSRQ